MMQSNAVFVTHNASKTESTLDTPFLIQYWQSWAVTDTGNWRKRNEDAILNRPDIALWAVADGLGGHEEGEVASQLIVETLQNISLADDFEITLKNVNNCLQSVNTQLLNLAEQKQCNSIIGSTVVVFLAQQQQCAVLWAGDSRLYRLRNQQLQQLTQDHCPDYGYIPDECSVKIFNEVTRAVGAEEILELDCKQEEICEGDLFLLCSDGLDKDVSPKEIEQVLLTQKHEKIVDTLLELCLQRGAKDNVSIILAIPTKAA
jgi:type VI secretion system protein ImpM